MLYYIFCIRLKQIFSFKINSLTSFSRILYLLLVIIYAVEFTLIYNQIANKAPALGFILIRSLNAFLWLVILIRNVFPSYNISNQIINFFPISKSKKIAIDFLSQVITPLIIYILILCLMLNILGVYNYFGILVVISLVANAILCDFLLRTFIENKKNILLLLFFLVNVYLVFKITHVHWNLSFSFMEVLQIMCTNSFIILGLYFIKVEKKNQYYLTMSKTYWLFERPILLYSRILLRRNSMKISILFAFIFKAIVFIAGYNKHADYKSFGHPLIALSVCPATLFTYVFNNYFGYAKETFYYLGQRLSIKQLFKEYLWILLLPLFFDFLFSVILVFQTKIALIVFLSSYLVCTSLFLIIGFISSVWYPIKIESDFSIKRVKNNSNTLLSILTILISIIAFNLANLSWSIILISSFLIFIYFMYRLRNMAITYKNVYEKLFKTFYS